MKMNQIHGTNEDHNAKQTICRQREFEASIEKNKVNRRFTFSLEKEKENLNSKMLNGFDHRSKSKQPTLKEDRLYTEAKLNPEMTTKNLGVLQSPNNGHVPSTNMKTPKN